MTASAQTESWDSKLVATAGQPAPSAVPTAPVIPKTVDYGHGHGMSCEEEHVFSV